MIRRTFQGLWARKRRVVGTATAIILGVAFLAGTLVLGRTFDDGFSQVFRQANAGTDVVVRTARSVNTDQGRQRAPLDEQVVADVADVPGVAKAVGQVTGTAQVLDADGKPIGGQGPPTEATAWVDDPDLNPYRVTSGRAPSAAGEAVLDRGSARLADLQVGDTATVLTPEPVELEVVGLVSFGDAESMGGANFVGLSHDQAVDLVGEEGKVSQIVVRGDGSTSAADLAEAVSAAIPKAAEAVTGADVTAEQQADIQGDFLGFLKAFLLAFAGVALVVATFSISNTFTIIAAQRGRESALLRAIGATRRQVLGMAVLEALAIGVVASALGVVAGLGLAAGLRALLSGFGLDLPGSGLSIAPGLLAVAFVLGIVVTLVAAILPAVRSSRIAPIEALRDTAVESVRVSRIRAAIGAVLAIGGVATVVNATTSADGALGRAGLGSLIVFVAAVVLGPVVARPAAAIVGAPIAVGRGTVGRLARRNAMRNPRRTAGSALALLIGAAVVALFATFGASIQHSIDQTVSQSFGGDLVVMNNSFSGSGISPDLAEEVGRLPEVAEVLAISNATVKIDGSEAFPSAGDPEAMANLLDLDVQDGSIADLRADQIAVTQTYADDHDLKVGSTLPVEFPDGAQADLEVGAVFGVAELMGDLIMTDTAWAPHALQPGNVAVLVGLRDGTGLDDGRAAVEQVAKDFGSPTVQDRDEYIDLIAGEVNQLLFLVYGLLGLAILIALIGLANTLSLSIHERTRELGLLRAVGLTRGGLRSTVRWESVITAVVGTAFGLAVGTFLGWGLVRAMSAEQGFVSFRLPAGSLVVVVLLSVGAGVVAALRPAHRASRIDVLDAIAEA